LVLFSAKVNIIWNKQEKNKKNVKMGTCLLALFALVRIERAGEYKFDPVVSLS
jgi:hypothetical protein